MSITTHCEGKGELPVGKIVAVGRNYADHAAEMGAPRPTEPLLFLKPSTALLQGATVLRLPRFSKEIHHEVELVVRVSKRLSEANVHESSLAIDSVAVGLDLTARDLQAEAKKKGEPWAVSKGFDGAAPLSQLVPVRSADVLSDLEIELSINGLRRQFGRTSAMLWSVPELLSEISHRFTLLPGDLVFTGTPAGVGPLHPGDVVSARLGSLCQLKATVAAAK